MPRRRACAPKVPRGPPDEGSCQGQGHDGAVSRPVGRVLSGPFADLRQRMETGAELAIRLSLVLAIWRGFSAPGGTGAELGEPPGITGHLIEVEAQVDGGLPATILVGVPGRKIREICDRGPRRNSQRSALPGGCSPLVRPDAHPA